MVIVHDLFVCKPGNASRVAKLFKEVMAKNPHFVNVMTDIVGQYHRVIIVSQYKNLAEYEKSWEEMSKPNKDTEEAMKKMEGLHEMYLTGSKEIYKTW